MLAKRGGIHEFEGEEQVVPSDGHRVALAVIEVMSNKETIEIIAARCRRQQVDDCFRLTERVNPCFWRARESQHSFFFCDRPLGSPAALSVRLDDANRHRSVD